MVWFETGNTSNIPNRTIFWKMQFANVTLLLLLTPMEELIKIIPPPYNNLSNYISVLSSTLPL